MRWLRTDLTEGTVSLSSTPFCSLVVQESIVLVGAFFFIGSSCLSLVSELAVAMQMTSSVRLSLCLVFAVCFGT